MRSWVVRQSFRSPLRVLVAALCLLFASAPTLPALHFLLIAHVICPEHGELLHGESLALERAAAGHVAVSGGQPVPEDAWVAAPEAGHHGCAVPAWGNSSGIGWETPVSQSATIVAVLAPGSRGALLAHRAIALLSYAPKLAPPCQSA